MLIQISAVQIPHYWEAIKLASISSDGIPEEFRESYFVALLQDLLSGKRKCFVTEVDGKIGALLLMEFRRDKVRNTKTLFFSNVYSFTQQADETWMQIYLDVQQIAHKENCYSIEGETNNERIKELMRQMGVPMKLVVYELILGG